MTLHFETIPDHLTNSKSSRFKVIGICTYSHDKGMGRSKADREVK